MVYAVFDYTAQQPDELSFKAGQQFTILRKGDENEREWWWSRLGDKEGYVPRNLLGVSLTKSALMPLLISIVCCSYIQGLTGVKNNLKLINIVF